MTPEAPHSRPFPATVTVVGAGTMGSGIARLLLDHGSTVTVIESGPEGCARAEDRIRRGLERDHPRDHARALLHRLHVHVGLDSSSRETDLVIETVPEDAALKARVLAEACARHPGAVVATNTSSLTIGRLTAAVREPERVLGLHFFNPVPASALIELVRGAHTRPSVVDTVRRWCAHWGKATIVVRDSPGFATSRLGVLVGLEAVRMLESGVAGVDDIDTAMTLGYRHPMGPLLLSDLVGLDVRLAIATHLAEELGPRFTPPRLLREKVAVGDLGRKTGRGFYTWTSDGPVRPVTERDGG